MLSKLVLINYNSDLEVLNLINESDFDKIGVVEIVVISNGRPLESTIKKKIKSHALTREIILREIFSENNGYAAAINHFKNLELENFDSFDMVFFANCDLIIKNNLEFDLEVDISNVDILGFPVYQKERPIFGEITQLTPLIPAKFYRYLDVDIKSRFVAGVHGGFFGVSCDFLKKCNEVLTEKYFMYWDELDSFHFFSMQGSRIFLSNLIKIKHEGVKTISSSDARYYMFRNGLHFYFRESRNYLAFLLWFCLNTVYRTIFRKDKNWYISAIKDFSLNKLGKRAGI